MKGPSSENYLLSQSAVLKIARALLSQMTMFIGKNGGVWAAKVTLLLKTEDREQQMVQYSFLYYINVKTPICRTSESLDLVHKHRNRTLNGEKLYT